MIPSGLNAIVFLPSPEWFSSLPIPAIREIVDSDFSTPSKILKKNNTDLRLFVIYVILNSPNIAPMLQS